MAQVVWRYRAMLGRFHGPRPVAALPPGGALPSLQTIGTVRNGRTHLGAAGWERLESRIELLPPFVAGLCGLDGFSHIIALTWLHLVPSEDRVAIVLRPGDPSQPPIGVFALRVPGRPNPLGCSVVPLLGVEGSVLRVRGLDAVDGTPVLDLKPYLPAYDSVPDAVLPGWARSG